MSNEESKKIDRKKAEFKTVDSGPLVKFQHSQNYTDAKMGEILGVSGGSISNYRNSGKCPPALILAIEGLRRRQRQDDAHDSVYVLRVPADKKATIKPVLEAFGLTIKEI